MVGKNDRERLADDGGLSLSRREQFAVIMHSLFFGGLFAIVAIVGLFALAHAYDSRPVMFVAVAIAGLSYLSSLCYAEALKGEFSQSFWGAIAAVSMFTSWALWLLGLLTLLLPL